MLPKKLENNLSYTDDTMEDFEDEPDESYAIYSTKLVKFRDTKLQPIRFLQSGSRGKMLVTFDQRGTIRFHKLRGIK